MKNKFLITKKVKNDLIALEKNDQRRIVEKLRFFIADKQPLKYAKKLKDSRFGTYRFRIGNYRIIFDIDKNGNINILVILRIKHRREVYEQ